MRNARSPFELVICWGKILIFCAKVQHIFCDFCREETVHIGIHMQKVYVSTGESNRSHAPVSALTCRASSSHAFIVKSHWAFDT